MARKCSVLIRSVPASGTPETAALQALPPVPHCSAFKLKKWRKKVGKGPSLAPFLPAIGVGKRNTSYIFDIVKRKYVTASGTKRNISGFLAIFT
jgi:hypothetical protein